MTSLVTSPSDSKTPAGSGRALAETTITMPASELGRILANVTLAASKEATRPILTCVLFSYGDGRLSVTATDSYLLLRETVPVDGSSLAFVAMFPAPDLAPVVKAAKVRTAEFASIVFDGTSATFKVDGVQVSVRALDGSYPNVGAIIDNHTPADASAVMFASGLITKAAKVVPGSDAGRAANGYPMRFTFDGQLKPARIDWQSESGAELFAIVMPTRS